MALLPCEKKNLWALLGFLRDESGSPRVPQESLD